MPVRRGGGLLASCGLAAACLLGGWGFIPAVPLQRGRSPSQGSATAPPAEPSSPAQGQPSAVGGGGLTAAVVGLGLAVAGAAASHHSAAARAASAVAAPEAPPAKRAPPPPPPFDPATQPGVTLPLLYFDPAGFCKVGDKEGFRNFRTAELKHGRVAMMAALGAVMQHWLRFPGFEQVPSGIEAVITPPGTYGLVALVLACGALETVVWVQDPEKEPGDFGDPLGVGQYYEEWRNREINNGRAAMIAIMGILVAELVSGKDGVDQIWTSTAGNLPVE